jgi:hypothetical protein
MKGFDAVMAANKQIMATIAPINPNGTISFNCNIHDNYGNGSRYASKEITRDEFKKHLLRGAWNSLFNELGMQKYVTESVKADINKFIEQQTSVPFTIANIQAMVKIIVGTTGSRMNRVVVEVFDKVTEQYHENRHQKEGWKTNSEYIVNQKFIISAWNLVETDSGGGPRCAYGRNNELMDDLVKAMCYVTGKNYDEKVDTTKWEWGVEKPAKKFLYLRWLDVFNEIKPKFGEWFTFNQFRVKVYKMKSMHVEFINENEWVKFNQIAASAKGFQLASKFTGDFRKKQTGVEVYNHE